MTEPSETLNETTGAPSSPRSVERPIYTIAVHAGEDPERHLGALSVPVYRSAVFAFPNAEQGAAIHEGEQAGYFYGRMGNPTQAALESALCALEGGEAALALASGMAAITNAIFTVVPAGGHIVAPRSLYHPKVGKVHYPGLPSHPQHALACQQMAGFGGMIAFEVKGIEEGRRLIDHLAVSLGDVATLIRHSASMTHASVPRDRRLEAGIAQLGRIAKAGLDEASMRALRGCCEATAFSYKMLDAAQVNKRRKQLVGHFADLWPIVGVSLKNVRQTYKDSLPPRFRDEPRKPRANTSIEPPPKNIATFTTAASPSSWRRCDNGRPKWKILPKSGRRFSLIEQAPPAHGPTMTSRTGDAEQPNVCLLSPRSACSKQFLIVLGRPVCARS